MIATQGGHWVKRRESSLYWAALALRYHFRAPPLSCIDRGCRRTRCGPRQCDACRSKTMIRVLYFSDAHIEIRQRLEPRGRSVRSASCLGAARIPGRKHRVDWSGVSNFRDTCESWWPLRWQRALLVAYPFPTCSAVRRISCICSSRRMLPRDRKSAFGAGAEVAIRCRRPRTSRVTQSGPRRGFNYSKGGRCSGRQFEAA